MRPIKAPPTLKLSGIAQLCDIAQQSEIAPIKAPQTGLTILSALAEADSSFKPLVALPGRTRSYGLFISHRWAYNDEYERVVNLLNGDRSFNWQNVSVPNDKPLQNLPSLPKSNRYLVHQLDERISKADCLLVIAGMYCAHSGWIQSEIEAAKDFEKPIIAVEPRGQERFPEAVKLAADEIVGWTSASIIRAIRKFVPQQHSFPNLKALVSLR